MSTLKSARAQVAAQQALIEEKIVKAPFAGRLGIRQVDLGQYLSAGAPVVTLQALDPILIDFYLPQQALKRIKVGDAAAATIDTYPGVRFSGVIEAINSKVDNASRNVQVRASFHNADRRLVPGMYATVAVDAGDATQPNHPAANRHHLQPVRQYGLCGERTAAARTTRSQQRFVTLGDTRGDQVAVESGVKAG